MNDTLEIPPSQRRSLSPWKDQARTLRRVATQLGNEMTHASAMLRSASQDLQIRDLQIEEARNLARLFFTSGSLPVGMSRENLRKRYPWLTSKKEICAEKGILTRS